MIGRAKVELEKRPGQDVEYVVVDDEKLSRDRVVLLSETPDEFDTSFYRDELIRLAESILSPLGWKREGMRGALQTDWTPQFRHSDHSNQ